MIAMGGKMKGISKKRLALVLCMSLTACATPYGEKLTPNYGPKQILGSITVSDAKLYRREALINERRREVRYIDTLLANTEKDGFTIGPEIAREIEVIRALAVDAGLSFDPAVGKSYRDAGRTSAIQQQIDTLNLQMQLEQLKRDASLFREKLGAQTEISNDTLGQAGTPTASVAEPTLTPADTAALVGRIDALQTALTGRLGATVAGPRGVTLAGNPIDQFRDRAAYRTLLTTARNAASLDELHDIDGAALYRLTFQVTTLPPEKGYLRTAGLVEMAPQKNNVPDDAELRDIYLRWLDYLNRGDSPEQVSLASGSFLVSGQLFSLVQFLYDDGSAAPAAPLPALRKGRAVRAAPAAAPAAITCPGLASIDFPANGCASTIFAAPDFQATSNSLAGDNRSMGKVVDNDLTALNNGYSNALSLIDQAGVPDALLEPGKCALLAPAARSQIERNSDTGKLDIVVSAALMTLSAAPFLGQSLDRIAQGTSSAKVSAAAAKEQLRLLGLVHRASTLLGTMAAKKCPAGEQLFAAQPVVIPARFRSVVAVESKVRVYEVGPREQVQQVSTAARAAEAFSLALALSAKDPSSGAAANAGLGYARSAIGKADVVERLPVVVGYAQAGGEWQGPSVPPQPQQPAVGPGGEVGGPAPTLPTGNPHTARFGWILGPRVNSIDPKRGSLALQQGQKTYDLSADISVSGWRTKIPLEVRTAWSPDWRSRQFVNAVDQAGPKHVEWVQLNPSASEFGALTQTLGYGGAGQGLRSAMIDRFRPAQVKACAAATLVLHGDNLWRATDIVIGGKRLGGDAIAVLPDMRGITVDIPAKTNFADISGQKVEIQVLTPYGVAEAREPLVVDGYDVKGCDKADSAPEGPAVASVNPDAANVCSAPTFTLKGTDLDKLTRVRFGAADGKLSAAVAEAKERDVSFTADQLATIASEVETMQFFAGDKSAGAKAIRLVSHNCGDKS